MTIRLRKPIYELGEELFLLCITLAGSCVCLAGFIAIVAVMLNPLPLIEKIAIGLIGIALLIVAVAIGGFGVWLWNQEITAPKVTYEKSIRFVSAGKR